MAKSQQTFNKKEKEKKKLKKREDKERKKEERKANSTGGDLESMLTYVDENGNFSSVAPDPTQKKKSIKADQIQIGVPKREAADESELTRTGKVTFFNGSKGYGFIKDERTDENVFVHVNGLQGPIKENDKVTFQVEKGPRGLNAIDVKVI